jgi:hypothetical protein
MMKPGCVVVVSLKEPREQIWGVLKELDPCGVTVEGMAIDLFDALLQDMAAGGDLHQHLSVLFFPMSRVERVLLDRGAAGMPSLDDRVRTRLGRSMSQLVEEAE